MSLSSLSNQVILSILTKLCNYCIKHNKGDIGMAKSVLSFCKTNHTLIWYSSEYTSTLKNGNYICLLNFKEANKLTDLIAEGTYARVYGIKNNNSKVARIIPTSVDKDNAIETSCIQNIDSEIFDEINNSNKHKFPFLVSYSDYSVYDGEMLSIDKKTRQIAIVKTSIYVLILDKYDTSLKKYMSDYPKEYSSNKPRIIIKLKSYLDTFYKNGISPGDTHPGNILVNLDKYKNVTDVVFTDLFLSKLHPNEIKNYSNDKNSIHAETESFIQEEEEYLKSLSLNRL